MTHQDSFGCGVTAGTAPANATMLPAPCCAGCRRLRNREEGDAVMRNPGIALARELRAFRDGAWRPAFASLATGRAALQRIGGSHAQRDVFERLTIEAAIRSGAYLSARQLIEQRTRARGFPDAFGQARSRLVEDRLRGAAPADPGSVNSVA